MKIRIPLLLVAAFVSLGAADRTTSPFITPAEAVLREGRILTQSVESPAIEAEIRNQLKYVIGSLNEFGGGAAIASTLKIEIGSTVPIGDQNEVAYRATFLMAYPQRYALPATYAFVLPEGGDRPSLEKFHAAYGANCSSEHHGWSGFFYDYRPAKCGLIHQSNPSHAVRAVVELQREQEYPAARPESEKIWEDGTLKAIAIFGNTQSREGSTRGAQEFYKLLTQWFGNPVSTNWQEMGAFSIQTLRFRFQRGDMEVSLFDLREGNVQTLGKTFRDAFENLTPDADYVAYNGHSGLGANIRAITRMGVFKENQYKVYFLNGCDSFSYVDGTLVRAHHELNPESSPTKFVDLITTVLPSQFNQMAYGTARILLALINGNASYEQVLSNIVNASPVVIGEEDNH